MVFSRNSKEDSSQYENSQFDAKIYFDKRTWLHTKNTLYLANLCVKHNRYKPYLPFDSYI